MSLRPDPIGPVPEETARVAQAAFPRGTAWMRLRDVLGPIYEDAMFAQLFSQRGRPAEAPWRLALVSVMQFAEQLSDRKAADAVRGRIDWKYALGLPLDDPGFDSTVLCEFRARLSATACSCSRLNRSRRTAARHTELPPRYGCSASSRASSSMRTPLSPSFNHSAIRSRNGSTFDVRCRDSGWRSTGSLSARAIVLLLRPSSLAISRRLFPRLCSRCTVLRSIRRNTPSPSS